MDLGLVGLGKMGGNMRTRLRNAGHTVVGYDRNPDLTDVDSLEALVEQLPVAQGRLGDGARPATRPATRSATLGDLLGEGDLVVDGGNSRWTDDQVNAEHAGREGHRLRRLRRLRRRLGSGERLRADVRRRRRGRRQGAAGLRRAQARGRVRLRCTPASVGAGHFAKMVHNGIEYAIMQAYAEGWELLEKVDLVDNVTEVFRSWREGTVIRSWLLDLLVAALDEDAAPRQDRAATPRTPARAGGPSRPASTTPCRCPRSPPRSSPGSSPARTTARR